MEQQDWAAWDSSYWKLEEGQQATVTLSNWRNEDKAFGDEAPRRKFVVDVLQSDGETYDTPKVFATASFGLVRDFRPICQAAEEQGEDTIRVILKKRDNRYTVTNFPTEQKVVA